MSLFIERQLQALLDGVSELNLRSAQLRHEVQKTATPSLEGDAALLATALELLEYVTWHDGRYRQEASADWQRRAQPLVRQLATRLDVEAYADYKDAKQ